MEVETKSACRACRSAVIGRRETSNGVPTRVDARSEAFADAGSTPAASTNNALKLIGNQRMTKERTLPLATGCPEVSGFVYMIQCGDHGGPIKIGYTAEGVASRLRQLQVGCPFALSELASIFVLDAVRLEQALKQRFAHERIRGEWFEGSYVVRSTAIAMTKLATRQKAQLALTGEPIFAWRDVLRLSVDVPNPACLLEAPPGSRFVDPREARSTSRPNGFHWRGKWRSGD
jgi:hypothetical protein